MAGGQALFGAAIASRLTVFFQAGSAATASLEPFPELTDREREMLALIAQGFNNQEIAGRLYISSKGVAVVCTHSLACKEHIGG